MTVKTLKEVLSMFKTKCDIIACRNNATRLFVISDSFGGRERIYRFCDDHGYTGVGEIKRIERLD